jgi:hypothetical protein
MNNVTVKSIGANYEKRQRERPNIKRQRERPTNLITQQSNIWKLNVDVILVIFHQRYTSSANNFNLCMVFEYRCELQP